MPLEPIQDESEDSVAVSCETTEEHRRLASITQQLSGPEIDAWVMDGEWYNPRSVPANYRRTLMVTAAAFAAFEHAIMKRVEGLEDRIQQAEYRANGLDDDEIKAVLLERAER
jgi:hypothetical protein